MKCLIVGAGPAGSFASYLLAKQGHDVTLIEEHPSVGIPVQCTGIVTPTIEELIKLPREVIKNYVDRARIISPDNNYIEIPIKEKNIILCRMSFDRFLAKTAQDNGAKLLLGHRFLRHEDNSVIIKDVKNHIIKRFTPDIIIGADGPSSPVAKSYGFYGNRRFFFGAQASIKMVKENIIEFYPIPGGICWSVPEGNNLFRVGVAVHNKSNEILKQFIAKHYAQGILIGYQGGLIPVYDPNLTIEKENVYLVGDAATQVKATTAGGIIQSLIAAKCLAESIERGTNYTKTVKHALGKELWLHLKIKEIMDKFEPEEYNKLIRYTNNPKVLKILGTHDRDKLVSFFLGILFYEPRYLLFATKLLPLFSKRP